MVNREPSFFISWTGERLDVPARGLLSRVMGVASRTHTAIPPYEVTLEREAALPMSLTSLLVTCLGEQFLSLRMLFFLGDLGCVHLVTGHEFAFQRLQTVRLSRGVNGVFTHVKSVLAVNEILIFEVTSQSENRLQC